MSDTTFVSSIVPANGLDIHVVEAGAGSPLLLLHGFPDLWITWRPLMEHLCSNFRLIAPDQRGYNKTTRPANPHEYQVSSLVSDCIGIIDALELNQVTLVGHDWGSLIAFWTVLAHPERFTNLIILNGSHPHLFQEFIWDNAEQRRASQYFGALQQPGAGKRFETIGVDALIEDWFSVPLKEGKITQFDIDAYRASWSAPGAWTAMLNWYRASPFDIPGIDARPPSVRWTTDTPGLIDIPTLLIWGQRDKVFCPELADQQHRLVQDLTILKLADAAHVPQRDNPKACATAIRDFLT